MRAATPGASCAAVLMSSPRRRRSARPRPRASPARRAASAPTPAAARPGPVRSTSQSTDRFSSRPSPDDLDGDGVARLHRPRVGRRAGEDDVAGLERDQAAEVGEQVGDRPDQIGGRPLLHDLAVEVRADAEVGRVEVRRDGQAGADRAEAVLALHTQHRAAVGVAEVVQPDVVRRRVAGDVVERVGLRHARASAGRSRPPPRPRSSGSGRRAGGAGPPPVAVQRRRRLHEVRRLGRRPRRVLLDAAAVGQVGRR